VLRNGRTLLPHLVAYTTSDLDAIRAARLRGIRTVKFADRETTYTSDAEMRQVEEDIKRDLATSTRTRSKQTRIVGSKGW